MQGNDRLVFDDEHPCPVSEMVSFRAFPTSERKLISHGGPTRRGGYMPLPVMTSALKEAKRRGIPIDERIHAPWKGSGPRQGIPRPAGGMHVGDAL
jgi:hypothetical protein